MRLSPGLTRLALSAVGAVCVWILAEPLPFPARALTVLLLGVMPIAFAGQGQAVSASAEELSRRTVYITSAVSIWVLAALALIASAASGFTARLTGLVLLPPLQLAVWSVYATAMAIGLMALARALRIPETPLLRHLLPRTARERADFVALSVSAGVGEELVFRGFLIPALTYVLGSSWAAAGLSAAGFGALHDYQGLAGALRASLLGFILAVPFVVTGSVVPSMIAHTAVDVIAGLWLADWLLDRAPERDGPGTPS